MRARHFAPLALLALTLLAGGCSKEEEPPTAPSAAPAGDLAALARDARLISSGKLTVCSDIPYAPFEFNDGGSTDTLTGFDVELVRAMAKTLGLTAEFKTTPFDSITEERRQRVAFTQPYFDADQSLLVRGGDRERYRTLADLKGRTIGVQSGTTGENYAKANAPQGATVKDFPGAEDLFNALASGDIDAVLQDFPVNKYRALKASEQFAVTETFRTGEQYGFAVAKENTSLVAALDAALARIRESGEYDAVYKAWFGG